jgi:uncharacterized membrane protein YhaH (DUF805 family)
LTEPPARSRFGTVINLLFGYDGRISRLYCWLGLLAFCAIISFFVVFADEAVVGTGDIGRYVALAFIVGIGIWMHSAVTIKRLHDRDKSAWWYLLYGIAPFGLFVAAIYLYTNGIFAPAWVLFAVSIAGLIWVTVELGFLRGTAGPNRYGPAP